MTKTPVMVRLMAKVTKTDTCWLFTGANNGKGYGVISDADRRQVYVHRVMWASINGPIPPGLEVCHRCDVRNCVNPNDLFLGTRAENEADKVAKGRAQRGEERWSAKLTEDDVRSIRLRATTERRRDLAAEYGVGVTTIDYVVTRKRWKHVA